LFRQQSRSHSLAIKLTKRKSKSCSRGQIQRVAYMRRPYSRKAYTRKDGTGVKASRVSRSAVGTGCTKARGLSKSLSRQIKGFARGQASRSQKASRGRKRSRQLFHLEKGVLGKYGYKDLKNKTDRERHASLNRALKDIKPLPLFRRVNALYVVNKNQDPGLAKKLKEDRDYIKSTTAYKYRGTNRSKKTKSKSKRSRKH